jgi:hypothetical protein
MNRTAEHTFSEAAVLREVDSVETTSLIDNCVDFWSTIERDEVKQVKKWGTG